MSEQLIHELFRGVESVVHERLVIAEDVLQKKQSSELAEMVIMKDMWVLILC